MPTPSALLAGSTCYLSGPMDFVQDRTAEATTGWRSRITSVLEAWGVEVFDPWFKPVIRNLPRTYGLEDETTVEARKLWTFEDNEQGAEARATVSGGFWPVMHTDLRMVDKSDFLIACCPTNLYSVGTPHEIVVARHQRKPVLFVSPAVRYPRWAHLERRAEGDPELATLLGEVRGELGIRANENATPSLWYTTLVGSESFFDGFGWDAYRVQFGWPDNYLDQREAGGHRPVRPLLPYLAEVHSGSRRPKRWDNRFNQYRDSDDWLLLEERAAEGAE